MMANIKCKVSQPNLILCGKSTKVGDVVEVSEDTAASFPLALKRVRAEAKKTNKKADKKEG